MMMIEPYRGPGRLAAILFGKAATRDVAAARVQVGQDRVERLVRDAGGIGAGPPDARDALLFAHAEHAPAIGDGGARVPIDTAESDIQGHHWRSPRGPDQACTVTLRFPLTAGS